MGMACGRKVVVWRWTISTSMMLMLAVLLAGCTDSSEKGNAQLKIIWPQERRAVLRTQRIHGAMSLLPNGGAIPLPSTVPQPKEATDADAVLRMHSMALQVYRDDRWISGYTLNRQAGRAETLVSLNGVPVGTYTFTATAHPDMNGLGMRLGQCAGSMTISKGRTSVVTLTTTAADGAKLSVIPKYPNVFVKERLTLLPVLKNPDGSLVIVPNGTYAWALNDTKLAVIDAKDGEVTGKSPGHCTVAVQDVRRNLKAEIPLDVMASYGPSQ